MRIVFLNQSTLNIGETTCPNSNFRNIQSKFYIDHSSEKPYVLPKNFVIYDQVTFSPKRINLRSTDPEFTCEIVTTPPAETPTPTPTP